MTLSMSENRKITQKFYKEKWIKTYGLVTLFCMLFSYIYSQFSHGVSSPHMTYLFLYPLILGVFVGMLFYYFEKSSTDFFWPSHFYHTGVVALVLGSLLRGIFEIAGTASVYQTALTAGGAVMLFCGIAGFAFCKARRCSN